MLNDFVELPLPFFLKLYPHFAGLLSRLHIDCNDSDYIVRFDGERFEFGYVSDSWDAFKNSSDYAG